MAKCIPCLQGMPISMCMNGGACDNSETIQLDNEDTGVTSDEDDYRKGPKRLRKNTSKLKDPQSTGRKEAAKEFPLNREADCEWADNPKAGGGKHPIKGCGLTAVGVQLQKHRHHGPDKNTMNNTKGNVHRICHYCHNRWHAANDEDYNPEEVNNE